MAGNKKPEVKKPTHVWKFDQNRRRYCPGPGAPSYRYHFYAVGVVGETPRSWLLNDGSKVAKADAITDEARVDDAVFVHYNRYRIGDAVRDCQDAETLRAVRQLLVDKGCCVAPIVEDPIPKEERDD